MLVCKAMCWHHETLTGQRLGYVLPTNTVPMYLYSACVKRVCMQNSMFMTSLLVTQGGASYTYGEQTGGRRPWGQKEVGLWERARSKEICFLRLDSVKLITVTIAYQHHSYAYCVFIFNNRNEVFGKLYSWGCMNCLVYPHLSELAAKNSRST